MKQNLPLIDRPLKMENKNYSIELNFAFRVRLTIANKTRKRMKSERETSEVMRSEKSRRWRMEKKSPKLLQTMIFNCVEPQSEWCGTFQPNRFHTLQVRNLFDFVPFDVVKRRRRSTYLIACAWAFVCKQWSLKQNEKKKRFSSSLSLFLFLALWKFQTVRCRSVPQPQSITIPNMAQKTIMKVVSCPK